MPLPVELRASFDRLSRGLQSVGHAVAPVVSVVAPVVGEVAASVGAAVSDSAERLIDETAQRLPRYSAAYLREQMANKQRLLTELSQTCVQLGVCEAEHRSDRHIIADLEQRFARMADELGTAQVERDAAAAEVEVLRDLLAADRKTHEAELGRLRDALGAQQSWHRERLLRSEEALHSWRGAGETLRSQLLLLQSELGGAGTASDHGEDRWSECFPDAQVVVDSVRAMRALLGCGCGGGLVEDLRASLEEARRQREAREHVGTVLRGLSAELLSLLEGDEALPTEDVVKPSDHGGHFALFEIIGGLREKLVAAAAVLDGPRSEGAMGASDETGSPWATSQDKDKAEQHPDAMKTVARLRVELRAALVSSQSAEREKLQLARRIGALETEYGELTAAMEEALVVEQQKDALMRKMKFELELARAEKQTQLIANESREASASELQSQLERALAEVAAVRAREEELRASLAAATESRESSASELQSSRFELERALSEAAAVRAREEELRASLAAASESREALASELQLSRSEMERALAEMAAVRVIEEQLRASLAAATESREISSSELQSQLDRTLSEAAAVRAREEELRATLAAAFESRESSASELQSSRSELERALAEMAVVRAREEELRASLAVATESREISASKLQSQLDQALAEVAAVRAREEELRASLAAATESREASASELQSSRSELERALAEVAAVRAREEELCDLRCSSMANIDQVTSLREKLIEEFREHESRHNDDTRGMAALRCRVFEIAADHDVEIAILNERIAELQRTVLSLERRNEDLVSELARIVGESRSLEVEISEKESRLRDIDAGIFPHQHDSSIHRTNSVGSGNELSKRSCEGNRQEAVMAGLASMIRHLADGLNHLLIYIRSGMSPLGTSEATAVRSVKEIDWPTWGADEVLSVIQIEVENGFEETFVHDTREATLDVVALVNDIRGSLVSLLQQKRRSDVDCLRLRGLCRELEHRAFEARREAIPFTPEVLDCTALRRDLASLESQQQNAMANLNSQLESLNIESRL